MKLILVLSVISLAGYGVYDQIANGGQARTQAWSEIKQAVSNADNSVTQTLARRGYSRW